MQRERKPKIGTKEERLEENLRKFHIPQKSQCAEMDTLQLTSEDLVWERTLGSGASQVQSSESTLVTIGPPTAQ